MGRVDVRLTCRTLVPACSVALRSILRTACSAFLIRQTGPLLLKRANLLLDEPHVTVHDLQTVLVDQGVQQLRSLMVCRDLLFIQLNVLRTQEDHNSRP